MAYESEVRRQANLLGDSVRNARTERNKVNILVSDSRNWWKGKASEAFAGEYARIDNEIAHCLRSMDSAISNLHRLPSLIDRAERERREKAMRLEAAKLAAPKQAAEKAATKS